MSFGTQIFSRGFCAIIALALPFVVCASLQGAILRVDINVPPGAISLGGAPVVFDSTTGIPLKTRGLDVQVTTWVSFKFGDTEVEVYPLLETAAKGIRQTAQQLYKELT